MYILGGTGVVSQQVENELGDMGISVNRLGGADRYDTSQKIVKNFDSSLDKFTLVTGKDLAIVGNEIDESALNNLNPNSQNPVIPTNPTGWVCPQIKSTARAGDYLDIWISAHGGHLSK